MKEHVISGTVPIIIIITTIIIITIKVHPTNDVHLVPGHHINLLIGNCFIILFASKYFHFKGIKRKIHTS